MALVMNIKARVRNSLRRLFESRPPACKVCGRPLYAPGSIERGMGSVCAGRHKRRDDKTIDMFEQTGTEFRGT